MTCRHEHCRERIIRCGGGPVLHPNCKEWIHALTGLHHCLNGSGTVAEPSPAERSTP